jgi:hypothetical protein
VNSKQAARTEGWLLPSLSHPTKRPVRESGLATLLMPGHFSALRSDHSVAAESGPGRQCLIESQEAVRLPPRVTRN